MKRLIFISFFIASVLAIGAEVFGQPAAPSDLTATAVSTSQINLTWKDNSTDELGFTLQRKIGAGGTYSPFDTVAVGANVTSYSSTGLLANTNYFYRVRAFNLTGNSAFSNEANATTLDNIPDAPFNLVATAASVSQIDLTWLDNSSNEAGFKIERKIGAGGTYSQIDSVIANVTNYSNNGLAPITNYFYRVRAYNTVGNSAYTRYGLVCNSSKL